MKISEDPSSEGEGVNTETGIEVAEDSLATVPNGSSAPDSKSKDDARTIKKRRIHEPGMNENSIMTQEQSTVMVPESASFAGLPFDILEAILERTGYLGDVVSVSKTCKVLRDMLKSQSASGLWRRMRNAVGIPDPSDSNFSEQLEDSNEVFRVERFVGKEADYAAFVFSEGDCEVCGGTSKRMFSSFALRLRLCGNDDCREQMKMNLKTCERGESSPWVDFIPTLETPHIIDPWGKIRYWPSCPRITRKDWIHDCSLDAQERKIRAIRTNVWMKLCVALCKWRDHWLEGVRRVKKRHDTLAKTFAQEEGWNYTEMLSKTSYGWFHNMKTKRQEKITEKDLEKMRPVIARELHEFKERSDRKKMMKLHGNNKKDIWKYYQKLISQHTDYPLLPPFTIFLKLPSIKLLQSSDLMAAKVDVRTAVRSKGFLKSMIKEEVENWVETTKRQMLATIGGSTEWNHMVAARRMPHPVLRLDAKWKCKLCNTVEPRYENDGCLDFAGICRHQCKEKTKKKRGEEGSAAWNIDNFVRDEQACSALATCLKYVEDVAEDPSETRKRIQEKHWRCISCDPPLFVHAQNIAGHSHRHPAPMQMEIMEPQLERNTFWSMKPPPNPLGVSHWLKHNSHDAKPWVEMANYGCQYCRKFEEKTASRKDEEEKIPTNDYGVPKAPETMSAADFTMKDGDGEGAGGNETKEGSKTAAVDMGTQKKKKFENTFNFNGLRSHLISKHKIHQIRDEDFWCYQQIDKFKAHDLVFDVIDWAADVFL